MNSEEPNVPGILNRLPLLEKILLCALAIGIILAALNVDFTVLRIALIGVAATFFLLAYRPPEEIKERREDEVMGLSALLALTILPKVLWISSAISVLGIALYFFELGNEGYRQALMIGVLTIGLCLVLLVIFMVSGVKYLKAVAPILLRAVPALLAGLYFFLK